jgi:hypothetical protein
MPPPGPATNAQTCQKQKQQQQKKACKTGQSVFCFVEAPVTLLVLEIL